MGDVVHSPNYGGKGDEMVYTSRRHRRGLANGQIGRGGVAGRSQSEGRCNNAAVAGADADTFKCRVL